MPTFTVILRRAKLRTSINRNLDSRLPCPQCEEQTKDKILTAFKFGCIEVFSDDFGAESGAGTNNRYFCSELFTVVSIPPLKDLDMT